jgi:hypothetical protein
MEEWEYKILSKYRKGRDLDERDRVVLGSYSRYVHFGYDIRNATETASLNESGIRRMNEERNFRSFVRRFFHNWKVCLIS